MRMNLQNKLIILTAIVSILIGPMLFLIEFIIYFIYSKDFSSDWTFLDALNPLLLGMVFSFCIFWFFTIWIIYGVIWAIYHILSLAKNFRTNTRSKNIILATTVTSLLLGPILFLVDTSIYGIQAEHWFIVGMGEFVDISIMMCVFVWFVYAAGRWVVLPPCLWAVKVFRKFVK
jgi:hypothetical protein